MADISFYLIDLESAQKIESELKNYDEGFSKESTEILKILQRYSSQDLWGSLNDDLIKNARSKWPISTSSDWLTALHAVQECMGSPYKYTPEDYRMLLLEDSYGVGIPHLHECWESTLDEKYHEQGKILNQMFGYDFSSNAGLFYPFSIFFVGDDPDPLLGLITHEEGEVLLQENSLFDYLADIAREHESSRKYIVIREIEIIKNILREATEREAVVVVIQG